MVGKVQLSIVIVTWNAAEIISECLDYIEKSNFTDYEVIILDNNSEDDTCDIIQSHRLPLKLIKSPVNFGFAKGNNLAFEHTMGKYVLLLNPDAFLTDKKTLSILVDYLDNFPNAAGVAPQLINNDGSHQIGDGGYALNLLYAFNHALFLSKILPLKGLYINGKVRHKEAIYPDWLCGACMMIRKSVIDKVGGLDENIFMYSEDVEWGERMRKAGLTLVYLPKIQVLHLQGGTQKEDRNANYVSTKWLDSKFKILQCNKGQYYLIAFKVIMAIGFILRAFLYKILSLLKKDTIYEERMQAMLLYAKCCTATQKD